MSELKPPSPRPVAFCWYHGEEMSLSDIRVRGCTDPEKQVCYIDKSGKKVCKHFHRYGEKRNEGRYNTMQEVYQKIKKILDSNGMHLEGKGIVLIKELPNGGKAKLSLTDAEKRKKAI